jgi:cyclase
MTMQRRIFIRNTAISAGLLAFPGKGLLAGFSGQQPFKIKALRNNISIFTEKGGTIAFLVNKDGIVVVDSEFPEQANHLIGELKKLSGRPVDLLINTHHHMDHSAGNIAFKGLAQHVLAHTNSKANQERVAKEKKIEDQQLYPDQTFGDTWCDQYAGEKICLYYYGAGHTNGDSLVHFQHANIVHMGDLLFNRRHPFIDRSAGANIKSWISVLEKAIDKFSRKTLFVYGHAADGYDVTGNQDDLKAFRDYLGNLLKYTEAEMKSGKTREEIMKATTIPGSPEWKGDGIDRPLQAAFEELTPNT